MSNPTTTLPPGFRFHPTDEELILHYLRNRASSVPCPVSIIAEVDIYKFNPWDLPTQALFGDREWYFFTPRDRKYPNGVRPNRAAASGYWKATGTDKPIVTTNGNENVGVKKALVFYKGKPPKGVKTDWIMHEYRLSDAHNNPNTYRPVKLRDSSMRLDDWVLCRIYKKSSHQASSSEQEESSVDDVVLVNNKPIESNMSTSNEPELNLNPLRLPKVYSLTELLEAVDCPGLSNMLGFENCSNGYTPFSQPLMSVDHGQQQAYDHQFFNIDSNSLFYNENYNQHKRQRKMEIEPIEGNVFNSFISQPLLNQNLFLNSHLGLH